MKLIQQGQSDRMGLRSWFRKKVHQTVNRMRRDPYPETVAEVLDDNITYRSGTHDAMIKFKKSRPWRGTAKEMQHKLRQLNRDLAEVYGIEPPQIVFVRKFAYGCCYFPIGNIVIMEVERDGRYSVATFLHEFGHALGKNEKGTCRWSINLFRHHFPKSFERLKPDGHLLYRSDERSKDSQEG